MTRAFELVREMRAAALYIETLHAARDGLGEEIVAGDCGDGPAVIVKDWVNNLILCASDDLAALFAEAEDIGLMEKLEEAASGLGVEAV